MTSYGDVNKMLDWAVSQIGNRTFIHGRTGERTQSEGYCQAFVATAYDQAFGTYVSQSTAVAAGQAWLRAGTQNDLKPPAGAAVYFQGSTAYGHVGLSLGNGYMVEAGGEVIKKTAITKNLHNGYLGWGWNGGMIPQGTYEGSSEQSGSSGGSGSSGSSGGDEISDVVVKSVSGSAGSRRFQDLRGFRADGESAVELLIRNDRMYQPVIEGEIKLTSELSGSPATLEFTVVKDAQLDIQEGNPVSFRYQGEGLFYGYIFAKSRSDSRLIKVTAYDQIRYLKNKDTLVYANKTYGALLKMICDDYGLKWGLVDDTKHVIAGRVEEGTLLDILYNAADETLAGSGKQYVLYDDFGNLNLTAIDKMALPILIDETTAGGYSYESTIDKETYNRIKLAVDNDKTGEREVHIAQDAVNQGSWGLLQYYEKLTDDDAAAVVKEKAAELLKYHNKKQRTLSLSKVLCDHRYFVRGGNSLHVKMGLGDINVSNDFVVRKVTHTFSEELHLMDLELEGKREDSEFV